MFTSNVHRLAGVGVLALVLVLVVSLSPGAGAGAVSGAAHASGSAGSVGVGTHGHGPGHGHAGAAAALAPAASVPTVGDEPRRARATTAGFDLGTDHGLATDQAIRTFEEEGSVSAAVASPNLNLTVASEAATCGVEAGSFSDIRNDYLCLNYQQDTVATVTFRLPAEYWHPYLRDDKQSIADPATAQFAPVQNYTYQEVQVHFDGPTKAVYPIPKDVTASFNLLERADNRTSNLLGVDLLPGSEKTTGWRYAEPTLRDGDGDGQELVYRIRSPASAANTAVYYDATPNQATDRWLPVPEDPSASAALYRTTRANESSGTIYIVFQPRALGGDDPPRLRYRAEGGPLGEYKRAMRQIRIIDDWVEEQLANLPYVGHLRPSRLPAGMAVGLPSGLVLGTAILAGRRRRGGGLDHQRDGGRR